jgi:aquaporin Z
VSSDAGDGLVHDWETEVERRITDFDDPKQEWRRLLSEAVGTFFLVLVAAGAPMVGA